MSQRLQSLSDYLSHNSAWLAAALGSIPFAMIGTTGNAPVLLALKFILCDLLTGLAKGVAGQSLSSRVGYVGLKKKCGMLLAIAFGHLVDQTVGTGDAVKGLVCFYLIGLEAVSIIENLACLGIVLPPAVTTLLNNFLSKEGIDESAAKPPPVSGVSASQPETPKRSE